MKDLIIVGAGSSAREYLQFIKDINKVTPTYNVKGFIADTGVDIKLFTNGEYDILGTIVDWKPKENEEYVCSISDPIGKRKVVNMLRERGAVFANLIHPTAIINDYTKIGNGLIMYPHSTIGVNCNIGNFVTVSGEIAHDNVIGDFVTLSGGATLSGHVTADEAAFFGAKSIVAPDIKVGKEAFVCIGSVVIRNVRAGTKVLGNPAKRIEL